MQSGSFNVKKEAEVKAGELSPWTFSKVMIEVECRPCARLKSHFHNILLSEHLWLRLSISSGHGGIFMTHLLHKKKHPRRLLSVWVMVKEEQCGK